MQKPFNRPSKPKEVLKMLWYWSNRGEQSQVRGGVMTSINSVNYAEIPTIASCAGRIFARLVCAEQEGERWIFTDLAQDKRLRQWTQVTKKSAIAALKSADLIFQDDCEAFVPHWQYFSVSSEDVAGIIRDRLADQLVGAA
ncbi:MAG: hypothetical protein AAGB19_01515 [Cyanobacteria bacterium P01_F01_bin.3]